MGPDWKGCRALSAKISPVQWTFWRLAALTARSETKESFDWDMMFSPQACGTHLQFQITNDAQLEIKRCEDLQTVRRLVVMIWSSRH